MKASNLAVNLAMRSRKSSKPKLMLGRVSATDGPTGAMVCRLPLAENDGSNAVAILDKEMAKCYCSCCCAN